jgi:hypothetical protein
MTSQKRKNVSPERKQPPRNKRNQTESAVSELQNLPQNRYLEDQYDRFGKHVAGQLRELPLPSFVVLQEKIQSLITNEASLYEYSIAPGFLRFISNNATFLVRAGQRH